MRYDDEDYEPIIPDEALKLPVGEFLESYRKLYDIVNESRLQEIMEELQKFQLFIDDLTRIRNKYHKSEYLNTWELNEPDILDEIWIATKKLVAWDGKERYGYGGITTDKFAAAIAEIYEPALKKALEDIPSVFKTK